MPENSCLLGASKFPIESNQFVDADCADAGDCRAQGIQNLDSCGLLGPFWQILERQSLAVVDEATIDIRKCGRG